jgi:hypothetical protein
MRRVRRVESLPKPSNQRSTSAVVLLRVFVGCLGLGLAQVAVGCRASRSQDCERLVTSVNEVLSRIDRHIAAVDGGELTNVNDMHTLASLYETLGQRIAQMHLDTPELAREAQLYQAMVKSAAEAATLVANALVADDLEKALAAQSHFTALVAEEDKVVQRINTYCAQR